MLPPSLEHLFGTDRSGRDLFVTNIWAARISLLVGLVASVLSMIIGAGIGISAGYLGGRWDAWLMRFTDFFYVLPTLVLALVLAAIMGPSLTNVIVVIAITSWPATARVIRSADADHPGTHVRRSCPGVRRRAACASCASRCCPTCSDWCSPTRP